MGNRNNKMESLIQDFKNFSKEFRKSKNIRKRKKKAKVVVVPKYVKQDSNISEDSNDPKRRNNVISSIDHSKLMNMSAINSPLPIFSHTINEEPFHSDDEFSSSGSDKSKNEEVKIKHEESKTEIKNMKAKPNLFFVHRKVKNSRSSILADRPLTIFKNNSKTEPQSRFFSPPPQTKSKFNKDETVSNNGIEDAASSFDNSLL